MHAALSHRSSRSLWQMIDFDVAFVAEMTKMAMAFMNFGLTKCPVHKYVW